MINWRYSEFTESYHNLDYFTSIYVDGECPPYVVQGILADGSLINFFMSSDYAEAINFIYEFIHD